jgi:hypothetical protein
MKKEKQVQTAEIGVQDTKTLLERLIELNPLRWDEMNRYLTEEGGYSAPTVSRLKNGRKLMNYQLKAVKRMQRALKLVNPQRITINRYG